jgi:hypothetical protein
MSNKFITLLDKLGSLVKLGASKAISFEANPLVQTIEKDIVTGISIVDPPVGATLADILAQIVKVEQIAVALKASSGTGAQKLELVIPEVTAILFAEPIFKGKTPADTALFDSGVQEIVDGFTKVTNSFAAPATTT